MVGLQFTNGVLLALQRRFALKRPITFGVPGVEQCLQDFRGGQNYLPASGYLEQNYQ